MAETREDIASQALIRLGEPSISSFDEDTETAESVRQIYESTILGLLSRYDWGWASTRAQLSADGAVTPINEWRSAFLMPTLKTDRVGMPIYVFNSTDLRAPAVFDYEIEGKHIFSNYSTIVIEYVQRKAESLWPGYFEELAVEALAARLALPVTENASKEELHTAKAYGSPAEKGEGGLFGIAMRADSRANPTRGLLDDTDPMTAARFGGHSSADGHW
jgi:hypothetical protein